MPTIELGMTCTDAQEQANKDFEILPIGSYTMVCTSVEQATSKNGRPRLDFMLEVVENGNPDFNGKGIRYFAPLPHEGNTKGMGFLTQVCVALGKPWAGASLNTEDYQGRTCTANVEQNPSKTDPTKIFNNIKSFVV